MWNKLKLKTLSKLWDMLNLQASYAKHKCLCLNILKLHVKSSWHGLLLFRVEPLIAWSETELLELMEAIIVNKDSTIVFLGRTFYSHSASIQTGVQLHVGTSILLEKHGKMLGVNLWWNSKPFRVRLSLHQAKWSIYGSWSLSWFP